MIQSRTGHWFWWNICPCCTIKGQKNTISICITHKYQTLSNGCKMCLPQWILIRRGLCRTTS